MSFGDFKGAVAVELVESIESTFLDLLFFLANALSTFSLTSRDLHFDNEIKPLIEQKLLYLLPVCQQPSTRHSIDLYLNHDNRSSVGALYGQHRVWRIGS
ncbi:hypothetical protein LMG9673_04781 [Ralstonia pseudosolanacearum]|nr:hypothetical protein LMG9673_04781 [Ralstonia pseudosolanacearum]